MKKPLPYMTAAFLTVFLDLLSFGIIIPDLQTRAESLGLRGVAIGAVLSIYSVAQLLVAPYLGRLSDQVGRRKILLITAFLSIIAGGAYAFSTFLPVMILSRILLGSAAANLGVVYAYVSDVTEPQDRAKSMGMLGAAFGLGFLLGPPAGALLVQLNQGHPGLLGAVSAIFGLANFLFIYFFLPEAPVREPEGAKGGLRAQFQRLAEGIRTPGLGPLLVLFFFANFAFSNLESTFFRLEKSLYGLTELETSYVLVWVGIIAAVMQGALIRPLVKRFGEVNLLRFGYLLVAPTLALVPYTPPWIPLLLGCLIMGIGNGMVGPSLSSLISRAAPVALVGGVFGLTQSLGALARIVGPSFGNWLYEYGPHVPYIVGGAIMIYPVVAAWFIKPPKDDESPSDQAPGKTPEGGAEGQIVTSN